MLRELTAAAGPFVIAIIGWLLNTGIRIRIWTVVPILPHLVFIWFPCALILLLRRWFVALRLSYTVIFHTAKTLPQILHAKPISTQMRPRIAVVIPCLNVEHKLREVVTRAQSSAGVKIFAVDSGSTDGTWKVLQQLHAEGLLAAITQTGLGRSNALNTGAALALNSNWRPEILVFLHSDTLVPEGYAHEVREVLASPDVALGYFKFSWESVQSNPAMQFNQWYVNQRCAWAQLPWGDQAYFMRAAVFEHLRGFPSAPLMEDSAFLMACERIGVVRAARVAVATRPAKFLEQNTDWRCLSQMPRNHLLFVGWTLGVLSAEDVYFRYYKGMPLPKLNRYAEIKARTPQVLV